MSKADTRLFHLGIAASQGETVAFGDNFLISVHKQQSVFLLLWNYVYVGKNTPRFLGWAKEQSRHCFRRKTHGNSVWNGLGETGELDMASYSIMSEECKLPGPEAINRRHVNGNQRGQGK